MKLKKMVVFSIIGLLLVTSFLSSNPSTVEASKSNPKKAAVVTKYDSGMTKLIYTEVYLNTDNAKKLSKKLKNKNTKAKDVGYFLASLVPYIGPFLGADYMISGWKNKDDAAKIDKKLKVKGSKGIRVTYVEVKGRGATSPKLATINAWTGKASTVKSHYTDKKDKFKRTVQKKIYP